MFDKDGSGFISSDEIKEILGFGKTLSEEAVNEIIRQVDANGDGQISFEEFSTMMKRLSSWNHYDSSLSIHSIFTLRILPNYLYKKQQ